MRVQPERRQEQRRLGPRRAERDNVVVLLRRVIAQAHEHAVVEQARRAA